MRYSQKLNDIFKIINKNKQKNIWHWFMSTTGSSFSEWNIITQVLFSKQYGTTCDVICTEINMIQITDYKFNMDNACWHCYYSGIETTNQCSFIYYEIFSFLISSLKIQSEKKMIKK